MLRYIIYSPSSESYVKTSNGGWTSGHVAEAVNSYDSEEEAQKVKDRFDSLQNCDIIEVQQTVTIIK